MGRTGDIDAVVVYIGQLIANINESLENGARKFLLVNSANDILINDENIDTLLKNNILISVGLTNREPMSLDSVPFGPRKNWNIHGIVREVKDPITGEYRSTDHVYRYDNFLKFDVYGKNSISIVKDMVIVQEMLDAVSHFVSKDIAERMFFYAVNEGAKLDESGVDYLSLVYYVRTQRVTSEVLDIVNSIDMEVRS